MLVIGVMLMLTTIRIPASVSLLLRFKSIATKFTAMAIKSRTARNLFVPEKPAGKEVIA
ncbi:hypothetical protein KDA_35440 [Dictyobacter alpinus]|uniref:Uncharacterized protein n=1 Tax=Dictyobacter alpinus TaxID=2014873 RepID=A0A402B9S5_9CHLR|nr:hypothetical protein KDA_35440 [Dictyobacter alpinus]